ncbi:hypothetical protein BGZ51_005585 [Haplosporangium sp. Z 767]|nr:hypothetical protein BGZ51_005585 [Haplosporangium sp. Z 767]KAF9184427.1 hypothetical protein BGZ50_003710 [Haplosporangium sp. Z 11]
MGVTVSTLSVRKSGASSVDAHYLSVDGKKPSLFQRSKSSLQFRKRSKSSLTLSESSNGSKGSQVVPNRHFSTDSSDHSDLSLNSDDSNNARHSKQTNNKSVQYNRDGSANSNTTTEIANSGLPEWARQSRVCKDGRTRHTVESAPYMLPNDLTESDRLDAQHYLVRFILKGNYNVKLDPEDPNLRILDVATGTGVWALEMAHEFPKAEIHGVDISSIFPADIKPSNCHFQLCNILDGLPFPDNHFDFIYQRLLVYALSPDQRRQVNAELLRVLKPEGHLQLVESDGIVYNAGPEMEKVNQLSLETSLLHGVDPREVQTMKSGLKHAGYTAVNSFNIALPVGDWGGKAGSLSRQNMHGLATIWLKGEIGRMDQAACNATLEKLDKEIEELQSYYKVWLVVGQKPSLAATQQKEAKKAASLAGANASKSPELAYPSPETTSVPTLASNEQ